MIHRLVQMSFRTEEIAGFIEFFESRKATIRGFEGCCHLELWQDAAHGNIFFTYSIWETEEYLNRYRFSDFFKDTWSRTKELFDKKSQAWSVIRKATA
jgi:heme-degrading monooxygenase HmoA